MSLTLDTLLDVRRRGEDEAERLLTAACGARRTAEEVQRRLDAAATLAADRHGAALADAIARPATTGADGLATDRFVQKLRDRMRQLRTAAGQHRAGPLAAARAAEERARHRHLEARRAREAVEKLKEREDLEAARVELRRAEDAASDLAAAAHRRRRH